MPEVLDAADRRKVDDGPDDDFYDEPRFVTHADDAFLARLTALYDEVLAPGDRVFDAMSSWVSHLPDERYDRVVGHGLNEAELAENDRLDEFLVQDLNADQALPLADETFDAVLCALSVQYLQHPGPVFAEFARVLAPGGALVVSFTNRMFPTKAVRAWRERDMDGRAALVRSYVDAAGRGPLPGGRAGEPPDDAGGFVDVRTVTEHPGRDPFSAVVARRVDPG